MQVVIPKLTLKMAEKFSFESKNENEKGKMIEGYFLTFIDMVNEKIVITSSDPFVEFDNAMVDAYVDLQYREFGNKKGFKLKVNTLTASETSSE